MLYERQRSMAAGKPLAKDFEHNKRLQQKMMRKEDASRSRPSPF